MPKRGFNIDSLVLIFSFIVVAQLLSYVVTQGTFDREPFQNDPNRMVVVAGTFEAVAAEDEVRLPAWHFLIGITKGLAGAQDIIFLIFIVGGVIEVIRRTGAIDAALHRSVERLGHSPWILILGCFLMFGAGSFTIGMGEEYMPLIPIIVTMCLAMRMDGVVAMGMVWIPYGIGWGCAGFNPFNVVIAQSIAGVPLTSGAGFRFVMMLAFLALGFHHLYRYARKVQADPSASLVSDVDYSTGFEAPEDTRFTGQHVAILLVFLGGLAFFVWGAQKHHWFVTELNTIFFGIGIVAALIARLSPSEVSQTFLEGAAKMAAPALIVGFARAIAVVLEDGQIIDSVVHSIAGVLDGLPPDVSAVGMLIVQSLCNFFIPSGTGQAFVTMPIMSPLATLTDVPQQTAVLAFQFGDGFTNMIVPTNALVVGALALGKVPYTAWFRFMAPLMLKILVLAAAFIVFSVHYGDKVGLY
ncbi:MAG: TIGR00366 family protein [Gammaproteobacteria bacterium]|nr:TIGR00366 family protein [Gammaproteobacteria bacterium]MBT8104630.1 TIGR00366 family protein [Gammaproteobacteria bacterium]NNF49019.1 YfcC family protein [Woeseiaceae bacterium]NNK24644.1 YfcC family protein [Woeseiaceae bacterium]NNL62510.1 YfcC family protein [Woeseiaceae bacterium]